MGEIDRGAALLDVIYDDVDQRLNPDQEECWHCGGEGETYDCIDGCCVDADSGCPDCALPCLECRLYAGRRAKAIREEVIKSGDLDIAVAWLKSIGRWREGITPDQVRQQLEDAKAKLESQAEVTRRVTVIIAGLDSALRRSGAAVLNGRKLVHAEAFLAKGERHGEIFHNFRNWWRPFLEKHAVQVVALESPLMNTSNTTGDIMLGLSGTYAQAIEICTALGIPYEPVNSSTWRMCVYGKGTSPPKTVPKGKRSEWWKERALEYCRRVGWDITSKDAAESACIAYWCATCHLRTLQLERPDDLFAA